MLWLEGDVYALFEKKFMKNKLKIGLFKNSLKNSVVTYRKASVDVEVKKLMD